MQDVFRGNREAKRVMKRLLLVDTYEFKTNPYSLDVFEIHIKSYGLELIRENMSFGVRYYILRGENKVQIYNKDILVVFPSSHVRPSFCKVDFHYFEVYRPPMFEALHKTALDYALDLRNEFNDIVNKKDDYEGKGE